MAVLFTKELSTTNLLFSLNNNVIRYYSDGAVAPLRSTIQIGTQPNYLIYPDPSGNFEFNFKELVNVIINDYALADNYDYDLFTIVDYTDKVFLNQTITITIFLVDDTSESTTIDPKWLFATTDKRHYKTDTIPTNALTVLTPQFDIADEESYLKFWLGYPFEYCIYNGLGADSFYFRDGFVVIEPTTVEYHNVMRIPICDGAIGTSQFGLFPTELIAASDARVLHTINFNVDENPCGEYYIKWINNYGCWNYWLFNNGSEQLKTQNIGEINSNFDDYTEMISQTRQIGVNANETITVSTDVINENQALLLKGLLTSPKIYLWTGVRGVATTEFDWSEIKRTTTNTTTKNPKQKLNEFSITFELPDLDTRKL